jgi:hypothetical protein
MEFLLISSDLLHSLPIIFYVLRLDYVTFIWAMNVISVLLCLVSASSSFDFGVYRFIKEVTIMPNVRYNYFDAGYSVRTFKFKIGNYVEAT